MSAVVLLHGLARSARSLRRLEAHLRAAGHDTCNIGYPSTKFPVETLVERYLLPRLRERVNEGVPVNFVTHSMGGILVRQLRRAAPEIPVGRVVMLGPPNHGSELVDRLRALPPFRWVNGPAGQQLGTGADSLPNRLGPADFELGIIAGNRPFLEPFTAFIDGPSDGKVSVASTQLEGLRDCLVLPVTHSLMMWDSTVIAQTAAFLATGRFTR